MRAARKLALVTVAALGLVGSAKSFALVLPDRWVPNLSAVPANARGPAGEVLQISSSSLTGQGSPQEAAGILRPVTASCSSRSSPPPAPGRSSS